MKNLLNTRYFALIAMMFMASSCNKNDNATNSTPELTDPRWKVVNRSIDGTTTFPPAEYILSFGSNQENFCDLTLDINSCSGTFELEGEDNVSFDPMGCTEACCDTLLSFSNIQTYTIDENTLHFYWEDEWIKLEKLE